MALYVTAVDDEKNVGTNKRVYEGGQDKKKLRGDVVTGVEGCV